MSNPDNSPALGGQPQDDSPGLSSEWEKYRELAALKFGSDLLTIDGITFPVFVSNALPAGDWLILDGTTLVRWRDYVMRRINDHTER